ncbi:MAG TPA: hypothetical protein TECP_00859 [Hyphomicrobiaceae bacterium MAG_BT-2024]
MPAEVKPLIDYVVAPPELAWRLAHIGLVEVQKGYKKQKHLKPGQRLVSLSGDLWRWDGLVVPANSFSQVSQHLTARNHLKELAEKEIIIRNEALRFAAESEAVRKIVHDARQNERYYIQQRRKIQKQLSKSEKVLAQIERVTRESHLSVLHDRQNQFISVLAQGASKSISRTRQNCLI